LYERYGELPGGFRNRVIPMTEGNRKIRVMVMLDHPVNEHFERLIAGQRDMIVTGCYLEFDAMLAELESHLPDVLLIIWNTSFSTEKLRNICVKQSQINLICLVLDRKHTTALEEIASRILEYPWEPRRVLNMIRGLPVALE
jgi:hypothetical protein